jgi:hypothetical protein
LEKNALLLQILGLEKSIELFNSSIELSSRKFDFAANLLLWKKYNLEIESPLSNVVSESFPQTFSRTKEALLQQGYVHISKASLILCNSPFSPRMKAEACLQATLSYLFEEHQGNSCTFGPDVKEQYFRLLDVEVIFPEGQSGTIFKRIYVAASTNFVVKFEWFVKFCAH